MHIPASRLDAGGGQPALGAANPAPSARRRSIPPERDDGTALGAMGAPS